jgi:hypothetical protein
VTPIEFTREETVNWKSPEIVNLNLEREVGQATLIFISMRNVETVVPGKLDTWLLIDTTSIRLLFLS